MNTELGKFSSKDGRSARWQAHRQSRRQELLRLARKAIHRRGSNVSMDEIAESAGTSKSVFYRYFGDKSGLQTALAEQIATEMLSLFQPGAEGGLEPEEGIRSMVGSYLEMAAGSANVYFFVTEKIVGVTDTTDSFAGVFATLEEQFAYHYRRRLHAQGFTDMAAMHTLLWPKAAIGLVRATGEAWLAQPASPHKPSLVQLRERITGWLLYGLTPTSEERTGE